MSEFLTDTNILLVCLSILVTWLYSKIKAAIRGTAFEAELGELMVVTVEAAVDGRLSPQEARSIGKEGVDTWKALVDLLDEKKP